MRRERLVVLSPHFDDAGFSIGRLLQEAGAGLLINVFSKSLYLARVPVDVPRPLTEPLVNVIRNAEDERFATLCGLSRRQLGLAGPELLDRRPNDLQGMMEDVLSARPAVMGALTEYRQEQAGRPFLLVPMAIGRHVNHHAVHQLVREQVDELACRFRLGFYEDLPYAHDPVERIRALRRFAGEWHGHGFERHAFPCSWQDKRELVGIYHTQLRRPPAGYKFRPAAVWPLGMHEAVWMRSQDLEPRSEGMA